MPASPHATNYHHPSPSGGYAFFMPTPSLLGPGSLATAGQEIAKLGHKKALIVTDQAGLSSPTICAIRTSAARPRLRASSSSSEAGGSWHGGSRGGSDTARVGSSDIHIN